MKTLPTQFTKNGFTHRQILREGSVAVFERQGKGHSHPHFETVVIGSHNGYVIAGVRIEPAETYPSSEQWGSKGFTFRDEQPAKERFYDLLKLKGGAA